MTKWRMIALNMLVTVLTALTLLMAREAYFTWQRVNSLIAWAQARENARTSAASVPTPVESPKK